MTTLHKALKTWNSVKGIHLTFSVKVCGEWGEIENHIISRINISCFIRELNFAFTRSCIIKYDFFSAFRSE